MPLPHWLARVNREFTNRFMRPLAMVLPWFAVVEHRGRRSGTLYRTPINVFRRGDRYAFALTYGADVQWVQNVLAAGECQLVRLGGRMQLVEPRLLHDPRRRPVPMLVRLPLGLIGVNDFLEMRRAQRGTGG
jgi:deazaflavin-dependent oxidoreductase (nitroreductase family)